MSTKDSSQRELLQDVIELYSFFEDITTQWVVSEHPELSPKSQKKLVSETYKSLSWKDKKEFFLKALKDQSNEPVSTLVLNADPVPAASQVIPMGEPCKETIPIHPKGTPLAQFNLFNQSQSRVEETKLVHGDSFSNTGKAWIVFMRETLVNLRETPASMQLSFSQKLDIINTQFKSLSQEEKQEYLLKYQQTEEIKDEPKDDVETVSSLPKTTHDKKAIKRKGWLLYQKETSVAISIEQPDLTPKSRRRLVSDRYQSLTKEAKKEWLHRALDQDTSTKSKDVIEPHHEIEHEVEMFSKKDSMEACSLAKVRKASAYWNAFHLFKNESEALLDVLYHELSPVIRKKATHEIWKHLLRNERQIYIDRVSQMTNEAVLNFQPPTKKRKVGQKHQDDSHIPIWAEPPEISSLWIPQESSCIYFLEPVFEPNNVPSFSSLYSEFLESDTETEVADYDLEGVVLEEHTCKYIPTNKRARTESIDQTVVKAFLEHSDDTFHFEAEAEDKTNAEHKSLKKSPSELLSEFLDATLFSTKFVPKPSVQQERQEPLREAAPSPKPLEKSSSALFSDFLEFTLRTSNPPKARQCFSAVVVEQQAENMLTDKLDVACVP